MNKNIVVGTENFDEFIRENGYYVDKTELLYELAAKTHNKVTLFTRPRRFGKTLTMSMIGSFFDIQRDSRAVFDGLDVMKHEEFCAEWMNQYPVLFLSLKDVEGLEFVEAYAMLVGEISQLCIRFSSLEIEEKIDPADAAVFRRLKFKTASEEEIRNSLKTIMRMMNAVYGKPVILLIDEYDVPLSKAKDYGYYREMLSVVRGLMSASLKTNDYLKFAVITGCLRISKESIFTGVNNFASYSVMNRRFSGYFGFTLHEVERMLISVEHTDKLETIRNWYDGYIFGNSEVFCPWDVARYLSNVIDGETEEPENFWANTSGDTILKDFLNHPRIDPSDKFEILLNGGSITEDVTQELTYDHYADNEKGLWSVLLMTGYVSKADQSGSTKRASIRIPNKEIAEVFRDAVVDRFHKTLDASQVDAFLSALWSRDEETASDSLSSILWNSISYFDYAEAYYHGIINGLLTSRGYIPDSNDETGLGRLDLRFRDKPNRRCLLFELKRSRKEENLDSDCGEAIRQIQKNGYAKQLPEGYEQQICYGIAFYGKKAKVKLMK